jgi:hypothetical protein
MDYETLLKNQLIEFGVNARNQGRLTDDDAMNDKLFVLFIGQLHEDVKTSDYTHAYYKNEDAILTAVFSE